MHLKHSTVVFFGSASHQALEVAFALHVSPTLGVNQALQVFYDSSMSLLCTLIKPLKYLTVFTLSSRVASSSHMNMVFGCCWKAETVHMWLTPSSIALCKANDLCDPSIIIITWRNKKSHRRLKNRFSNCASQEKNTILYTVFINLTENRNSDIFYVRQKEKTNK